MSGLTYIDSAIEKKLLDLHTAYIAKVLSVSGTTAKIQPLGMTKEVGKSETAKPPISGVPIAKTAQYKITAVKEITCISNITLNVTKKGEYISAVSPNVTKKEISIPELKPISAGDIVVCVCGERDITSAKNGINSVPSLGHHSLSDSIIIGIL